MEPAIIGILIPIVAIIGLAAVTIMWIASEHKRKVQALEQNHRERMQAIDKGIELPAIPAGLAGSVETGLVTSVKALRSGIMWTLIGGVLCAGMHTSGGEEGALFGLIPAAVGIANLVYAGILWQKEKRGIDPGK